MPSAYVRAVQRAGARAVLLAPDADDAADLGPVLDLVDGVIVTAAAGDVDPARYGAERHADTHPVVALRDDYELALVRAAAGRGVPLLGICRGMQVVNVAHGGTLVQHLPHVVGHARHAQTPGEFSSHEVNLVPGSLAARAMGAERAEVCGYHHQGVDTVGDGLVVSAWSALDDGVIEAVECRGEGFVLGILWHPEVDEGGRVVGALVEAARANRLGSR